MRTAASAGCVLAGVLVIVGCDSPRSRVEQQIRRVGAKTVRHDAAVLAKQWFAGHGWRSNSIRPVDWPASFRQAAPLDVGVYPDGFSLAFERKANVESGVYVVPDGMDIVPADRGRARFERMSDGLYWYTFSP